MNKIIARRDVLSFLENHFKTAPEKPLGQAFIEKFKIPMPRSMGLEVFGPCFSHQLYDTADTLAAIEIILEHFTASK